MGKRRIEYEPHDGSCYSRVLKLLDQCAGAREVGDLVAAAGAAETARSAVEQLAEEMRWAAVEAGFESARSPGAPPSGIQPSGISVAGPGDRDQDGAVPAARSAGVADAAGAERGRGRREVT